jgi:hypothetical protein
VRQQRLKLSSGIAEIEHHVGKSREPFFSFLNQSLGGPVQFSSVDYGQVSVSNATKRCKYILHELLLLLII